MDARLRHRLLGNQLNLHFEQDNNNDRPRSRVSTRNDSIIPPRRRISFHTLRTNRTPSGGSVSSSLVSASVSSTAIALPSEWPYT